LPDLSDEKLWELSSEGDRDAQDELLSRYKDLVIKKARLYFMLGAEHDDIVQEGMIGLFKAIRGYDPERGASFRTFAELCVDSQILNAIKSAGRLKNMPLNSAFSLDAPAEGEPGADGAAGQTLGELLPAGSESDPESAALYGELEALISGASGLSAMESSVLSGLLDGRDYREIAADLGKTPKQIDNAIQRIKRKLSRSIFLS